MKNRHRKSKRKIRQFTLVELLVAMAVFSVIMLVLMQFFNSAQRLWTASANKTEMFENARIAINLMARDLQCAYYNFDEKTIRLFKQPSTTQIAFISSQPATPNTGDVSRLCEIQYRLNGTDIEINRVGDSDSNWDFTTQASWNTTLRGTSVPNPPNTSPNWEKVIPNVVALSISCYKRDNTAWTEPGSGSSDIPYPYAVRIDLTLAGKDSIAKWTALGKPGSTTDGYKNTIGQTIRTFSRTVIIERGQYD